MENKKMPEYLDYIIGEIREKSVVCKVKGEDKEITLSKKSFLDPRDLVVGETWRCYKDQRNDTYSYFSNLFNQKYLKSKFKDKTIYEGYLYSELSKEWIVKVGKDAYIRVSKNALINGGSIGDNIEFYIMYNKRDNVIVDLNRPTILKICEELSLQETDKIKLQIVDIERKVENEVDFESKVIGYDYTLLWEEKDVHFKLFLKSGVYDKVNGLEDNSYYLERNYEIFYGIKQEKEVYAYFKFDKYAQKSGKYFFYLDMIDIFKDILQEEAQPAMLVFYEDTFYIERADIGTFKFNTSRYSLVELTLLETLHKKYVCLELEKEKFINLLPLISNNEIEEEVSDVIIADIITTFSKRIIYQLITKNPEDERNYRMFVEERDLNYSGEILPKGSILEKVAFKYNVKNLFTFYTRLPYIENPLVKFLQDKNEGDIIYARVKDVKNTYIEIVIDGKYRKIIPQDKLKRLEKFKISDYYEKDKLAEFYIEKISKDDISLLGYNPEKMKEIYDNIKAPYEDTMGEILECYVQEGVSGLEGVYEERGEFLEVYVPNNEISFLGMDLQFNPKKKYQFRVIGKGLSNNPYGLVLSRKKLSKSIKNELEYLYPIGSVIGGVFFLKDKEGFYFNLMDSEYKLNMGDLIGYLPFNKIGLYPDIDKFKKNVISNYTQYKIVKYPRKFNSLNIREKAVELETLTPTLSLGEIIKNIGDKDIILDLNRKNNMKLLSIKEEKLYFEKEIENETIVFSIEKVEHDLLEKLYISFKEKSENPIYQNLFEIFKTPKTIELSFIGVDENNNTIELSLRKKIEKILLNSDLKFKQNKEETLLFGDELLNIPIVIENYDFILEKEQEYKIKNIINGKAILEVLFDETELLGKEYKAKIIEKTDNGYKGKVGDKTFIIESPYELILEEEVICEVKKIENGNIYSELKIVEELTENCGTYINEYIKNNIEKLSLDDLKQIISKDDKKYKYVDILNKYKAEIFTGYKLDKYLFLKDEFSNGAFGKVYKGINLLSADKVILKRYCADKSIIEYRSFQNESKLLKDLDLKSVMKVFYSTEDEYVGEYIEGETFRQFLQENYNFTEKLEYVIKIAKALDELHQISVYHLDIKPENIMIDRFKNVKLIDFGGSQSEYEEYGKFGTLIYSSPNQCISYLNDDRETIFNEKDDMYSFGILMYETFVGRPPYTSELGDDGIIAGHRRGRKVGDDVEYRYINPSELNPDIPEDLETIINRCLETEEEDRYDIMDDVVYELEKCL